LKKKENDFYKLRCQFGVLAICYECSVLVELHGEYRELNFGTDHSTAPVISLHEAASRVSGNNLVGTSCNCVKNCTSNRCKCKKSNTICNIKCHRGGKCENCRK